MRLYFAILISSFFCISVLAQEAVKIDEFSGLPCDDYLSRMDFALSEGRKNPSAKLVIIIYEGREPRFNSSTQRTEFALPRYGSANAKFRSIKTWLRHREFPVDRVLFVNGGFRERTTVEIWLVPAGATHPIATPTLQRLKYGRGKPHGFCTDCCGP